MNLCRLINNGSFSFASGEGSEFLKGFDKDPQDGSDHQSMPVSIDGNSVGHEAGLFGFSDRNSGDYLDIN